MTLEERIEKIRREVDEAAVAAGRRPEEITLMAATKVQTSDTVRAAIAAGIRACGENRVQEMLTHLDDNAYEGAELHFIGHLQTNKVKQVVGRVAVIESVGSEKLIRAIQTQAEKLDIVQDILLEINVGGEESKSGFSPAEALDMARLAAGQPNLRLRGLMTVPPISDSSGEKRRYFAQLRQLFVDIKGKLDDNRTDMDCLSMGMSGDFADAIAEGATIVRVGTALFGPRPPMASLMNKEN